MYYTWNAVLHATQLSGPKLYAWTNEFLSGEEVLVVRGSRQYTFMEVMALALGRGLQEVDCSTKQVNQTIISFLAITEDEFQAQIASDAFYLWPGRSRPLWLSGDGRVDGKGEPVTFQVEVDGEMHEVPEELYDELSLPGLDMRKLHQILKQRLSEVPAQGKRGPKPLVKEVME
jgi:hypothetical protein